MKLSTILSEAEPVEDKQCSNCGAILDNTNIKNSKLSVPKSKLSYCGDCGDYDADKDETKIFAAQTQ